MTAVMDSRSRWFVGWSSSRTFEPNIIMRDSIQRTFSPPESTPTGFRTSSPEKSILPRKPRRYVSVVSLEYCSSHWMTLRLHPLKNGELSSGK